jgi:hypothetical protein
MQLHLLSLEYYLHYCTKYLHGVQNTRIDNIMNISSTVMLSNSTLTLNIQAMKNFNKNEPGAVTSANSPDNETGPHRPSAVNTSEYNKAKPRGAAAPKGRKADEEDDLMKRGDFRYFYSGRKLL